MALTLSQIPGFADLSDTSFAANQYGIGINIQRVIENAKFGVVRPEVFVGRYINGETVPVPTSLVDGYTYAREELSYFYHFGLTGSTSAGTNGQPSQPGALRYLNAYINQLTGAVSTSVEYLVANGSAPQVTSDGTLEVFTIATRRLLSLVVAASPPYTNIADSSFAIDQPVAEGIMQKLNRSAKFAALSHEILYMGEYVDGDTVPQPISPADGYVYSYGEVKFIACWRWTTQGDSFTDPPNPNYKQIRDLAWAIDPATGYVTTTVTYYNSGNYPSTNGRLVVMAYCQRNVTLGAGLVDFVDMTVDLLASGSTVRADVLGKLMQIIRFSVCRTEFFTGDFTDGQQVGLPVSAQDGYAYSRDELTYIYEYINTGSPSSDIRIGSWNCFVDQATGILTSAITRVHDGGGFVNTRDGHVRVITVARRSHQGTQSGDYQYTGGGNGGADGSNEIVNGGFDNWHSATDQVADSWAVQQQSGTGYGAQAPGLVSGYSQRLGGSNFSIISTGVSIASGDLRYLSWVMQGSGYITAILHFYNSIGDTCSVQTGGIPAPAAYAQTFGYIEIPAKTDTTVTTSFGDLAITGTLDFIPTTLRVEFLYAGGAFADLDAVLLSNQPNPSTGQVAVRGSNSLASFPALDFTVTDTTFQVSTPVVVIQRADGTTLNAVVFGNAVPTTGLTQSTTYKWYPYLDEISKTVQQVPGDSGASVSLGYPTMHSVATRDAFVKWVYISNLPLAANPIDVVTLATPSGGGAAPPAGGSGGGDDGCLHRDMLVRERSLGTIPAHQLKVGHEVLSKHDRWLKVLAVKESAHMDWAELEMSHGGTLRVTAGHPFEDITGAVVRAHDLTLQHMVEWLRGVCSPVCIRYVHEMSTKIKITLEAPHVFYAGRESELLTLTHNFQLDRGASTL